MESSKHYIVTFDKVEASVGGVDISAIIEVQLAATANGVPRVTLLVDAKQVSGVGGAQASDAMSLNDVSSVIKMFRDMVKHDSSTLVLNIVATAHGDSGDDVQNLSITDWMLTDVAASPVQESGVCSVALTFMHPLCKAHFSGAVPGLLAQPPDFSRLMTASNPLDAFIKALEVYGAAAKRVAPQTVAVRGGSNTLQVRTELLSRLSKAASNLNSALGWSGGGLPAAKNLPSYGDVLAMSIAQYAMPYGGTSVLQRFLRSLVPECSLTVGGDYTKPKLEVHPFTPWADAAISISDSDIIGLSFPESDPSPVSGVQIMSVMKEDGEYGGYHSDSEQIELKPVDIFYVPSSELSAEYMYGPVYQLQEPGWLNRTAAIKATQVSEELTAEAGYQNPVTTPRGSYLSFLSASDDELSREYAEAALACGKAFYECSLMQDWNFSVNARLLFSSGGSIIYPGAVLEITSNNVYGNSEAVLGGYITSVTHSISIMRRSAHTVITCSHPRMPNIPDAIPDGNVNALYG